MGAVVRAPRSPGRRIDVTADLLKQTAASVRPGGQLRRRTVAGPLDILWRLHDGRTFVDLVERSSLLTQDDLRVRVLGLDDLIAVKSAIGRQQGHAALPFLEAIRRRGKH